MIFASDLDRTLIYSSKFIDENIDVEVVEYKATEPLSYMTKEAKKLLSDLRNKIDFVPVTTRTIEQYKRICLFHDERVPKYAITSNGGNVLINGETDLEWQSYISTTISQNGHTVESVYKLTEELRGQPWVEKARIADEVFFYLLVYKEDVDFEILEEWSLKLEAIQWELIEHGRKIYCIPKCVNKCDALAYVSKKMGDKSIVSSGDSRMDLTMKAISESFIVPRHGELVELDHVKESVDVIFTEFTGIKAAESILNTVSNI